MVLMLVALTMLYSILNAACLKRQSILSGVFLVVVRASIGVNLIRVKSGFLLIEITSWNGLLRLFYNLIDARGYFIKYLLLVLMYEFLGTGFILVV